LRDPEGRGSILRGALDGPQAVAVLLVVAGGFVLLERKNKRIWNETAND